jgi:ribosomal protein L11 methyltransferase
MFLVRIPNREDERDALLAELYVAGTEGVIEEDDQVIAFFATKEVAAAFGLPEIAPPRDYVAEVEQSWPSRLVGRRWFLAAPWSADATPEGRLRLHYLPGQACGTGDHPATRLCLEALEEYVRPGMCILDLGCGSGLLSIAARELGAGWIAGADIDYDSARLARENSGVPSFQGSTRSVRDGAFDLVVANINAETVIRLREELFRLAPLVVLSGFPEPDRARVAAAFGPPDDEWAGEGWCCLLFRRPEV